MITYETVYSIDGVSYSCIARYNEDGSVSFIPIDEHNPDYQDYLAWKNSSGDSI